MSPAEREDVKDAVVEAAADMRAAELNDIRTVLETRSGRRFFWRLLSMCRIFQLSFTTNSTIYYNEGIRSVGLRLLSEISEADEMAFTRMSIEAKEDDSSRREDASQATVE